MRDNAMRCGCGCKAPARGDAVTREVLSNFLAGEEEQPLEGQLDLDFELVFDTVDHSLLESLLRPDRRCHAGVCEDIVV